MEQLDQLRVAGIGHVGGLGYARLLQLAIDLARPGSTGLAVIGLIAGTLHGRGFRRLGHGNSCVPRI